MNMAKANAVARAPARGPAMDDLPMCGAEPPIAVPETCGDGPRVSGSSPPPEILSSDALLLDLDGTLIELAETPDAVYFPPEHGDLLRELAALQGGAVAIVSGRALQRIDELLKPLQLPAAGIYGAEMRMRPSGSIEASEVPEVAALARRMCLQFQADPRIKVENKKISVAVHFRLAPERAGECREALASQAPCPPLKIIDGKCVVEACPAEHDKGVALKRIMAAEPFNGRRPVFVGDDHSDEKAFEAAALLGGYGVKVGAGHTVAAYRLRSVREVWDWLQVVRDRGRRSTP